MIQVAKQVLRAGSDRRPLTLRQIRRQEKALEEKLASLVEYSPAPAENLVKKVYSARARVSALAGSICGAVGAAV